MTAELRPQTQPVTLEDALATCPGVKIDEDAKNTAITGVTLDSKDVDDQWIFVAIPGSTHHGIRFAADSVKRGAVAVVTDSAGAELAGDLGVPVVEVADPRASAALIAKQIYGPLVSFPMVAVTGTNGKTTTTYLVRSALRPRFAPIALMGTNEIDVSPRELYASRTTAEAPVVYRALATAVEHGYQAAVIEASSHALSLNRIDGLFFDSVIFTNLQHDHLDFYGTWDNYFAAKADLFNPSRARQGVVCVDDNWGQKLAAQSQIPVDTVSVLATTPPGISTERHWTVEDIMPVPENWAESFTLREPNGQGHQVLCPMFGVVNVQNAACALISAVQMGVPLEDAIAALAEAPSVPGRMQQISCESAAAPSVIVDYAHTPEAVQRLLESVRPRVAGDIVLVFGTDGDRDASKRAELANIAARLADRLWVTDENPRTEDSQQIRDYLLEGVRQVRPNLENTTEVITSRRDAIRKAIQAAKPDDLVLIMGRGAERYQEIEGVKHEFSDAKIAGEVLDAFL